MLKFYFIRKNKDIITILNLQTFVSKRMLEKLREKIPIKPFNYSPKMIFTIYFNRETKVTV